MKKIVVLGSTGSIGRGVLDVVRAYPEELKIIGLSANTNTSLLKEQVKEFHPKVIGVGEKELTKVALAEGANLVVVAVVGISGLLPTLSAIRSGKDIAIATKEVLVLAGELIMKEAKKNNVTIIPIDSEHSAIFQCLHAGTSKEVKSIILTMGKGPIAIMKKKDLASVNLKQIFARKVWKMGSKITVDSASCMNKSFEVIEARWLFNLSPNKIKILVHPEYICHSMVEFQDGSTIVEMGSADMKRYIQYALLYPQRKTMRITNSVDLTNKTISFEKAPFDKFPALRLGFQAIKKGGTLPAVMHGADESAVNAFLEKKITFTQIPLIIEKTMNRHHIITNPELNEVIDANEWGRIQADIFINKTK